MLIGTPDDFLAERDSLRGQLTFMVRHVANLAEEYEVARLELEDMQRRLDAVEGERSESEPVNVEERDAGSIALWRLALSFDLDLFGFGTLGFRQRHREHAILVLGVNFLRIDALRQQDGSLECAEVALGPVVLAFS